MTIVANIVDRVVKYIHDNSIANYNYASNPNDPTNYLGIWVTSSDGSAFGRICFVTATNHYCWVYCYRDSAVVRVWDDDRRQFWYCDPEYWNKLCDCLQYCGGI